MYKYYDTYIVNYLLINFTLFVFQTYSLMCNESARRSQIKGKQKNNIFQMLKKKLVKIRFNLKGNNENKLRDALQNAKKKQR